MKTGDKISLFLYGMYAGLIVAYILILIRIWAK